MQWEQVFGEGFRGVLTFIYWIEPPLTPDAKVPVLSKLAAEQTGEAVAR